MTDMDDLFENLMAIESISTPKVRETYTRASFGWPGGKWQSLRHIYEVLPTGKTLVDVCGGSGIVTQNAEGYDLRVFNDQHAGIVAFYRCIRDYDTMMKLGARLELCLHSREEFIWCKESWENCQDDIERAARWYYMLRTSFAQLGRNFGRCINTPNMLARKFHNTLADFPFFHTLWRDVQIENQEGTRLIGDFSSSDTVYYVDPDYIGADPGIYENRMNHAKLMKVVQETPGFFAVSGYDNALYNGFQWDDKLQWEVSVAMTSQAFSDTNHLADKADVMTRDRKAVETLWIKDNR